ncbi:hypothetical protein B9N43_05080 [Denitratisoma sp. DHT3]|uniref:Crp/Fnr family transcriptional regulator n=1 Tax=Denitratisoma sp. DHT3 TaxID=1981880 RepID=UPI001198751E|nr:Crp/Fnr family transcriptional regulator [Denitratisoma sp. DHT3]QDX80673.1 hypothetical protein B9N43_05080 [Denitratisoma sp. DHT3]
MITPREKVIIKQAVTPQRKGRSDCQSCDLRGVMVCSDVTVEQLADFHTWIDDFIVPPGGALFQAGTPADGIYCIRSGTVKLIKFSSTGTPRIVRIVKRWDVAGMESVFSPVFENTAVAVSEVAVCRIPVENFRRMVEQNPALQRRLLGMSQQALREAETWLSELAGGSAVAKERMARLLLQLRDGNTDRIHRFGLEDIGAMLGISIETASRILSDFTRQGVLIKRAVGLARRYYQADIAALERIAGATEDTAPTRPA